MTDLSDPIFTDESKAREHLEAIRWPDFRSCPHCGVAEGTAAVEGKKGTHRAGLYYCNACKKTFTVTVGTVMERSHVPLHKWVLAFHLMAASKKGVSAHQLHRMLGVSYKTAWFMAHRVREAMTDTDPTPMGGKGKIIEADETFIGPQGYNFKNDEGWKPKLGTGDKYKVVTLVERNGRARSVKVDKLGTKNIRDVLVTNASRHSVLMTDEAGHYAKVGREFKRHFTVNHGKGEYAKGKFITTNTVEGFFSIFKRGMKGIYQHCGEQHLQRYLTEFDFRYSNRIALGIDDAERRDGAIRGAEGKRLTYQQPRRVA